MKYVVVTIRRDSDLTRPRMRYPPAYDAKDVDASKRGPLVLDQGLANGDATEEMLMWVNDRLANAYVSDPDMREITEAEADTWLGGVARVQERPEEVVTDVDRMVAIQAKVAAGVSLSTEDMNALDPDHAVRGINRKLKTAAAIFGA